jgi:ABC-type antimicrobial peptide transport system permease subunit
VHDGLLSRAALALSGVVSRRVDIVSAEIAPRRVQVGVLGTIAGAAAAAIAGSALQSLLADVSPTDGVAFALAMLMTIAGSLLPALRAVRVDPIEVMRAE